MNVRIMNQNGVSTLLADGKPIDSLAFKSFRPTKNNVSDFYNAGVRIFHVYCSGLLSALKMPYSSYGETWFGDGVYDFKPLDDQIEMFLANAPDAYLFINLHLDVRAWWQAENPGRPNSFTHLSQIAADEKWRADTAAYLQAAVRHVEEKYDDHVLGYFLLGGTTTEWFSDYDYEASHPIKLAAFRAYMNDDRITIPEKERLEKPETQFFLDPNEDAVVIAYRQFHADLIADLVLYYCHAAQEVLAHKKPVGVFFGYILELTGPRIWNAGHLAIDKVYRSKDVDLIATPSSYQFRSYDDASALMLLSDTLEMNNILYFDSFDHMTFLAPDLPNNPRRLSTDADTQEALNLLTRMRNGNEQLDSREKTIHAMRREFMQRLARRTGMWWFDMLEGWFFDDGLMDEVRQNTERSRALLQKERHSNSEIAVFVSCESLYYVNKCARVNTEVICNQRDGLARMGAPYDLYSLNDVTRVDMSRYKLVIFLDAFSLTPAQRDCINRTVKRDGRSVLFVGPADYIDENGVSLARTSALAEMNIALLPNGENKVHAFDSSYGYARIYDLTPYVDDPTATCLGRFAASRMCALARKERPDCTVYFSALGNLNDTVLRQIARTAGVHIYTENGVPVFANSGIAGVYNTRNEFTVLTLPKDGTFTELFSGKTYRTDHKKVVLPTGDCPAQLLILD